MFQMTAKQEDNQLTLALAGRIDSTNAAAAEAEINGAAAGFAGALALDIEKLDYISSAGLRVILRLKKSNADMKIINASSEVYEIFDMTGFTEMMEIAKAYRKLSVDGCEVIGEGANGKVYRIDADTIVKVYKNHDALEEIHNERELARKAFVMGVPTAIPYDVVQVGDLYGSVFELLNAKSFAKLMIEDPSKTDELAKASVDILKTMHSTMLKPGELPDKKKEAVVWAEYCLDHLPADVGEKLVALVKAVPDTLNMLHGDYHIKNIMQQNGENLLIDMDTLAMGHPPPILVSPVSTPTTYTSLSAFPPRRQSGSGRRRSNTTLPARMKRRCGISKTNRRSSATRGCCAARSAKPKKMRTTKRK